ncbi:MAG TPA: methylenetetrahydrofolate reductase [Alphaproteobacteria bacterium]|nr:methylenetetrahydrofolate reductase [Alphaproteobacteria bacterium]
MDKARISEFTKGYSIETTLRDAARVDNYGDYLPKGTQVFVAHIPGTTPPEAVALAKRIKNEGMDPVPHIVARRTQNLSTLEDLVKQMVNEAGVEQILLVAGDIPKSEGELDNTLQILDSGIIEKYGIKKIRVAGHPEGHVAASAEELRNAIARKNAYAKEHGVTMALTTQFTFDAKPIFEWENAIVADGNELPYYVGLPGLATLKTLIKFAMDCGVGESLKTVTRHASNMTKLLAVTTPDDQLIDLAKHVENKPDTLLRGIHFFPFGGMKRTAEWANKIVAGEFELVKDGKEIKVS